MNAGTRMLSARAVRWLDVGVAVWIVAWIVVGLLAWHDIGAQGQLSRDVIKVGTAVKDTGQALGVVGGLPLVGDQIGRFAQRIESMGSEVEASGQSSRDAIQRVAVTSGLAAAILPAALVLLLYLPLRASWRRDVRSVAAALGRDADDPALQRYLAYRAIATRTWDELRAVTPDPWKAVAEGDLRALADLELARIGQPRPG